MEAPSSWALTVTISEPTHITTKTVVKTWEVCFAGAFDDSISASDRQISSGPLMMRFRSVDEMIAIPPVVNDRTERAEVCVFDSFWGSFGFLRTILYASEGLNNIQELTTNPNRGADSTRPVARRSG